MAALLTDEMGSRILQQMSGLPVWKSLWNEISIVVVGSAVMDLSDEFSDIDVFVYIEKCSNDKVSQWYDAEISAGTADVLNPSALEYHEFPMIYLKDLNGHYEVETYQDIGRRVKACEDAFLWICSLAKILHDPGGRFAELKRCSSYPQDVLQEKLHRHYPAAWNGVASVKTRWLSPVIETRTLKNMRCIAAGC